MPITQAMCISFKRELLEAVHNFTTHTFKIALYTDAATLSAATTAYTVSGEVSGAGYTAGGAVLTTTAPSADDSVALVDFADVSWPAATLTARGALVYNSSVAGNPAVVVLDFGADRSASNSTFTVQFPVPTAASAIVRIV
jgi:hypothetical protein